MMKEPALISVQGCIDCKNKIRLKVTLALHCRRRFDVIKTIHKFGSLFTVHPKSMVIYTTKIMRWNVVSKSA
jgi:hypothetical protein